MHRLHRKHTGNYTIVVDWEPERAGAAPNSVSDPDPEFKNLDLDPSGFFCFNLLKMYNQKLIQNVKK